MDGWMDDWMDGWMDGWITVSSKRFHLCLAGFLVKLGKNLRSQRQNPSLTELDFRFSNPTRCETHHVIVSGVIHCQRGLCDI